MRKINTPLISYVLPVYNGEKYLREALDSVVNQPCKDFEIIAVDDGSKDNSLSILEEYKKQFNNFMVIQQKNSGVSKARNEAIKKSSGDYIFFLDQDDCIITDAFNDHLRKILNSLKEEGTQIICFKGIYSNKNMTRFRISENELNVLSNRKVILQREMPVHFAFYSRKFLIENNLFFFEKYNKMDTDSAYFHKVYISADNIKLRNDIKFYIYRSNPSSVVHTMKTLEENIQIMGSWFDMYEFNVINKTGAEGYCLGWLNGVLYYAMLDYFAANDDYKYFENTISQYKFFDYLFNSEICGDLNEKMGIRLYNENKNEFIKYTRKEYKKFKLLNKLRSMHIISGIYELKRYPQKTL